MSKRHRVDQKLETKYKALVELEKGKSNKEVAQSFGISSELFEEWIKELDRSFGVQKRKIALIVDNCPAHPTVTGLEWIELIFLPPNTTSVTQPMDQGVIRALKEN